MSRTGSDLDMSIPDQAADAMAFLPRLTRAELASLWRVSLRTIERREASGIGPHPIRIGGRVLYRREDVLAWEQAQIHGSEG